MSKFIVVFSSDWADEFQCEKYTIYDELEAAESAVQTYVEEGGWFGTNEGWEEGELSESDFEIKEISTELANELISLLGRDFGTGLA